MIRMAEMMQESENIITKPEFGAFVDELDQKLNTVGAAFAEQAFGLGISLSIIPAGVILIIAIILGARNWITISLVFMAEALVAVVIASFLASRARQGALRRVFRDEVKPEIRQFLETERMTREQFVQQTIERLPGSSILVQHLMNEQNPEVPLFAVNPDKE